MRILALTATATEDTFKCVVERLSMQLPKLIGLPPNRDNIKYVVKPTIKTVELAHFLCGELKATRTAMPKSVLFCTTLQQAADIYTLIKRQMGSDITEPPDALNILRYRLVDMFTSGSTSTMRERILEEFCKTSTKLRLIIATSAFGLGIDCPELLVGVDHQHWKIYCSNLDEQDEMGDKQRLFCISGIQPTYPNLWRNMEQVNLAVEEFCYIKSSFSVHLPIQIEYYNVSAVTYVLYHVTVIIVKVPSMQNSRIVFCNNYVCGYMYIQLYM